MLSSKNETRETVMPSGVINEIWSYWESKPELHNDAQSRVYRALFCDIAQHFPNFVLDDLKYLFTRKEKEGMSFYLERLPLLGKAFETSLITLEPLKTPSGFKFIKGTRLPKFLGQLFSQLFHNDGTPIYSLTNQSQWNPIPIEACRYIRQVCLMWSKVETFTDVEDLEPLQNTQTKMTAKTVAALESFIERCGTKISFGPFDRVHQDTWNASIIEARRLLRCVFSAPIPTLDELKDFVMKPWGRQGPGAVAGREVGSEKWSFNTWPGLPKELFLWRDGFGIDSASIAVQPDARLCCVPKDFRGPRVICIEPKENQFAQQGIMDILYRHVHACNLTKRSISFLDTDISRNMCYNTALATIDMKDASDMISLNLARLLFPRWVFKLVTRYRSRHVMVRELNKRVRTQCLATMGNATCFPLETLVFWAIALGTMITIRDSYHPRQQKHLNLDVRVFGDDIIVPLWAADAVACTLEASGLVVNKSKTCTFTPVRESCGEWTFMKKPVRIFKFRTTDVTNLRAFFQWRDQLKDLGQSGMTALENEISEVLCDFFPPSEMKTRFNKKLQRMEVYAPRTVQLGRLTELVDAAGLYAWHVHNDRTPILNGARKRVKMGWQDRKSVV